MDLLIGMILGWLLGLLTCAHLLATDLRWLPTAQRSTKKGRGVKDGRYALRPTQSH